MYQTGKDVKVIFDGKELLVRNVEVSYTCDDLPSVSIEGYLPREETVEVTMKANAADIMHHIVGESGTKGVHWWGQDMGSDAGDATAFAHYTAAEAIKLKQREALLNGDWTYKEPEETNEMAREYYGEDSCEAKACDDGISYGAYTLAKKIVDLGLDDRQRLIQRHGLKQEDGTLTQKGREVVLTLLFDEYEDEIVEALEEVDKADAEARK